jgi:hypothetical protein
MAVPWWFFLDACRWSKGNHGYRNIVAGPLFFASLPVRHAIKMSSSGSYFWLRGSSVWRIKLRSGNKAAATTPGKMTGQAAVGACPAKFVTGALRKSGRSAEHPNNT